MLCSMTLSPSSLACSFSDNFLSPIPVSDRLMFYSGNLILYQKRNENDKSTTFFMKNNQKKPTKYIKYIVAFFAVNSLDWPVM